MTKAQRLLDDISRKTVNQFDKHGEAEAMFYLVPAFDDQWIELALPMANKARLAESLRYLLQQFDIVRYALVSEAWTAIRDNREEAVAIAGRVSEQKDRIEILVIQVEDRDTGELLTREYRILRPKDGKPKLGEPAYRSLEDFEVQGRFTHLFDTDDPS
jgi:hypothetical protein